MSIDKKANRVLEQARQLFHRAESWADFSAALFDYSSGLITKVFPEEMERQAFFNTEQHEKINRMLIDLIKKFGVVGGATPKEKNGKVVDSDP